MGLIVCTCHNCAMAMLIVWTDLMKKAAMEVMFCHALLQHVMHCLVNIYTNAKIYILCSDYVYNVRKTGDIVSLLFLD